MHFTRVVLASLLGVVMFGCADRPPPPAVPPASPIATADGTASPMITTGAKLQSPTSDQNTACTLECGNAVLKASEAFTPDHHEIAVSNVDAVFTAMHDDLLACYRKLVSSNPNAHASVTLELVINPDGTVRSVSSTGGAMLGDSGLRCITKRVALATFAPVHDGGTLHAEVPLLFRRMTDESL